MKFIVVIVLALAISVQASYPPAQPIVYQKPAKPIVYALQKEEPSYSHATVSAYTYSIHHPQPSKTVVYPQPTVTKVVKPHVEYKAPVVTTVVKPHTEYGVPKPHVVPHSTYGVPKIW